MNLTIILLVVSVLINILLYQVVKWDSSDKDSSIKEIKEEREEVLLIFEEYDLLAEKLKNRFSSELIRQADYLEEFQMLE